MKKLSRIFFIAFAISAFGAVKSFGQIEVSIRPVVPEAYVSVRRPPPPSADHVWVAEGWRWDGARYVYRPGYWALPPHPHAVWVPGHWKDTRRHGTIWKEGHWA